ncbi:Undecaprenyl-phosphate alpha-N-acetylglucosaminyl 1-phosphate transferase [compost metagenome]
MVRRIRKGASPFKPDREHLHHICLRAGLSSHQALVVICGVATLLAVVGIALEYGGVPEWISLSLFILVFFLYYQLLNNIWRILATLRPKTTNESR